MTVRSTLQQLLDQRGENSHSLSIKTGVPQPSIHRVLKGLTREPRKATLQPLADFFGVDISALLLDSEVDESRIPLLNVPAEHICIPSLMAERFPVPPRSAYLMDGESMLPTIRQGDVLLLDPGVKNFVRDGIYLLSNANGMMVRRLLRESADVVSVIADNPHFERSHLAKSQPDVKIVAKAVGVMPLYLL